MDSLDRSETIEETSNLGEGLPKLQKANTCEIMSPLLGPSSSMHRSLSTDSNRAIASPRDDGTEHGEAVKNGWDMKTFMKSSKETHHAGSAHPFALQVHLTAVSQQLNKHTMSFKQCLGALQ
eukprot:1152060-Pelagomonas_calceolata.AAC.5